MAGSYNKMVIIGNLGADPDMQYTQSGQAVTHLRVAVNERRPQQDGQVLESTQWFRVTCWSDLAEAITPALHKGSLVYVEGALHINEFTGSDQQVRFSLEIRAREVKVLGSTDADTPDYVEAEPNRGSHVREEPLAPSLPPQRRTPRGTEEEPVLDDIPF